MERLQELINQLKEQYERKTEPSQMLLTTRLLDAELNRLASSKASAKVAVMMPSAMKIYTGHAAAQEAKYAAASEKPVDGAMRNGVESKNGAEAGAMNGVEGIRREVEPKAAVTEARVTMPEPGRNESRPAVPEPRTVPENRPAPEPRPVPELQLAQGPDARFMPDPAATARAAAGKDKEQGVWPYDPLAEIPTLAQQQPREINDVIGKGVASLNDKLKSDVLELKSALNDTPVRDLKKAIGINDRFVFISQLFRGDEVMYERSLKTINGFRILPEAEYWMERELKVKLGWDETREATKHFYQLVKRRFS